VSTDAQENKACENIREIRKVRISVFEQGVLKPDVIYLTMLGEHSVGARVRSAKQTKKRVSQEDMAYFTWNDVKSSK